MATNNSINQATGASGTIVQGQGVGSATAFSTATYPSTTTANQLLYSSATNTVGGLATGVYGTLICDGSGVPSWLANGTTGQILTATTGSSPSWQPAPAGGIPTIGTSTNNGVVTWNGTTGSAVNSTATTISSTGIINGPAGTSSAPTYSFTSNTNWGMHCDGSNLYFSTGGTDKVQISSGGVMTANNGLTSNGTTKIGAGLTNNATVNSTTSITIGFTNYVLLLSNSAARAATLPSSSIALGSTFVIVDVAGTASTGNITVTVSGGVKTINGAASYVMNTNYQSVTFVYDGTNYFTMAH